jgi:hypothetical protein
MQLSHWLSDPENLKSMRRLGTLGEGGFLMRNNLHGLGVERTVRYDVHRLNIPGWQSMVGQPIEEALGLRSGQHAILGYYNGNPVFANGTKNYIENVYDMGQGVLGVEVRETVGFGTGTKIDAGVKGLISGVSSRQMKRIRRTESPRASPAAAHIFSRARERPAVRPGHSHPVPHSQPVHRSCRCIASSLPPGASLPAGPGPSTRCTPPGLDMPYASCLSSWVDYPSCSTGFSLCGCSALTRGGLPVSVPRCI